MAELKEHKLIVDIQGTKEQIADILRETLNKIEYGTYYYESQLQYYLDDYTSHRSKGCINKLEFIPDSDCKR